MSLSLFLWTLLSGNGNRLVSPLALCGRWKRRFVLFEFVLPCEESLFFLPLLRYSLQVRRLEICKLVFFYAIPSFPPLSLLSFPFLSFQLAASSTLAGPW